MVDFLLGTPSGIYIFFCVVTALTAHYEIVGPVLSDIKENHPTSIANAYWLNSIICFIGNIVIAPATFICCIIPSWGEEVRRGLKTGLLAE